MEVFRLDGHLTDEALTALAQGGDLDELERLEIAEHLSFCDLCLQRYTDALTDVPLLTPQRACREALWRRIRLQALQLITSRYATAAAAVALALTVVWGSGTPAPTQPPEERPALSQRVHLHLSWWNTSLDQAVSGISDFFQTIQGGTNP